MRAKTSIHKNAAAVTTEKKDAKTFELTGLEVQEVSLVDKGANGRAFLVKKRAAGERGEVITGGKEIRINPIFKEDAETVAKDKADAATAANGVEAPVPAIAPATEPAQAAVAAPTAKEAPAASAAPAVTAAVVDEAAELAKLAAMSTKKADVTITPGEDGAVTVSVSEYPAPVPVAPQSVIDKVQAATIAGIDAIAERLAKLRSDVASGATLQNWSQAGQHDLWGQSWYLKDLIDSLCCIGGPMWEIEQAGDSTVGKSANGKIEKAHKAITAARLEKMRGIHKAMIYAHNDMDKLIKELDGDAAVASEGKEPPEPDRGSSFAKAAQVVIPAAAPAAVVKTETPAAPSAEVLELRQMVESLQKMVADQGAMINKSRATQPSNAGNKDIETENGPSFAGDSGNVKWPLDLADRREPQRGRKF